MKVVREVDITISEATPMTFTFLTTHRTMMLNINQLAYSFSNAAPAPAPPGSSFASLCCVTITDILL